MRVRFRGVATMAAAMVLALAVSVIGGQTKLEAAAGGAFTSVSISPTNGTTATTFVFSATYSGSVGATSVRAVAGSITVALSLQAGGSAKRGTWRASQTLPPGTRTFRFDALKQNNAIITSRNFGPVTVTAAPTPTPRPSPKPTPKPTPRPTTQPTTVPTNQATATPGATAGATPTGTGTPSSSASPPSTPIAIGGATESSPSPSAAAIGSTPTDRNGSLLLAALLGVLVIVGVGGIALLAGRRRAEEEPADGPALAAASTSTAPAPVLADDQATAAFAARVAPPPPVAEPPSQPPGAWDAYADIDDRPLGTVDELPPADYLRRPHGES